VALVRFGEGRRQRIGVAAVTTGELGFAAPMAALHNRGEGARHGELG
jgi:hypothetical protein